MKLPDQTGRDQIIAVTRRNKEVMAVKSWEQHQGLLETLEILSDPELMNYLRIRRTKRSSLDFDILPNHQDDKKEQKWLY